MSRCRRVVRVASLCAALAAGTALAAGCGGENPYQAARNATTTVASEDATSGYANNDFIPENQNLSDCIGALERPNCGSDAKGGWRQYLVLGVLGAGIAFIGWRIAVGIKARDAVVNAPQDED